MDLLKKLWDVHSLMILDKSFLVVLIINLPYGILKDNWKQFLLIIITLIACLKLNTLLVKSMTIMHLLVGTVNLKFGINFSRFKFQLKLIKNQLMLLLLILMVFILPLVVKDKLLRFGKLKKCKNHKFNLNLIVIYKI